MEVLTGRSNYYLKPTKFNNVQKRTNLQQATFKGIFDYDEEFKKVDHRGKIKKFFGWGNKTLKRRVEDKLLGFNIDQQSRDEEHAKTIKAQKEALESQRREIITLQKNQELYKKQYEDAIRNQATKAELEDFKASIEELKKKQEEKQNVYDTSVEGLNKIKEAQEKITKRKFGYGWGKIAGNERLKQQLDEIILQKLALEQGGTTVKMPNAIMLKGPKSTGKTSIAKALGEQSQCNYVELNKMRSDNKQILDDLENIAKNAKKIYEESKKRTIILVDEFDTISKSNTDIIGKLKTFLTDSAEKYKCTVITNVENPDKLASEVKAVQRFKVKINPKRIYESF